MEENSDFDPSKHRPVRIEIFNNGWSSLRKDFKAIHKKINELEIELHRKAPITTERQTEIDAIDELFLAMHALIKATQNRIRLALADVREGRYRDVYHHEGKFIDEE